MPLIPSFAAVTFLKSHRKTVPGKSLVWNQVMDGSECNAPHYQWSTITDFEREQLHREFTQYGCPSVSMAGFFFSRLPHRYQNPRVLL